MTTEAQSTRTRQAQPAWALSRRWRTVVLVVHVVAAIGWIGVDMALLPLAITGAITGDGETAAASYRAIAIFVPWTVPALSVLILATGILLGLGTKWGLVRYWWVATKLAISIVLTILVFVLLLPSAASLEVTGATTGDDVRDTLGSAANFLFPPIVSGSALMFATVLAVAKPWGRLRRKA